MANDQISSKTCHGHWEKNRYTTLNFHSHQFKFAPRHVSCYIHGQRGKSSLHVPELPQPTVKVRFFLFPFMANEAKARFTFLSLHGQRIKFVWRFPFMANEEKKLVPRFPFFHGQRGKSSFHNFSNGQRAESSSHVFLKLPWPTNKVRSTIPLSMANEKKSSFHDYFFLPWPTKKKARPTILCYHGQRFNNVPRFLLLLLLF